MLIKLDRRMIVNNFIGVFIYLLIGGALVGFAANYHKEKCGTPTQINDGYATAALLWPAALSTALIINDDAYIKAACD